MFHRLVCVMLPSWYWCCSHCREVYIELFRRWQWKRVALLAADGQNFPEYNSFLKDLFLSHSIRVPYDRKMPRQATFNEAGKVRFFFIVTTVLAYATEASLLSWFLYLNFF